MKHEFHAQFPFALHDSLTQGFAIAPLVNPEARLPARWPEIAQLKDDWARLQVLSQAIVTGRKEEARMGTRKMSGGLRYWIEKHANTFFQNQLKFIENLHLTPSLPELSHFPPGSWAIQLTFVLRTPYISRDDTHFYIIDNPVKKEHVFKVPYVAPSQWKGALRATMVRELAAENESLDNEQWVAKRIQLIRLFGNEKEVGLDDERFEVYLDKLRLEVAEVYRKRLKEITPTGFLAGCLHFYPTFFDRIGLEVINPHDRKTGAGKHPIYFECVPAGTKGIFTLLYVPMGVGAQDEAPCKADLDAVARGIHAMLTTYGFGAKTSSGYGVAKEKVDGKLWARSPNVSVIAQSTTPESASVVEPEETFLKYMDESGEVKPEFKGEGEGGLMSNKEYKEKGKSLGGSLSEFRQFRIWYLKHGEAWRAARRRPEPKESVTSDILQKDFSTLDELVEIARSLQTEAINTHGEEGKDA